MYNSQKKITITHDRCDLIYTCMVLYRPFIIHIHTVILLDSMQSVWAMASSYPNTPEPKYWQGRTHIWQCCTHHFLWF